MIQIGFIIGERKGCDINYQHSLNVLKESYFTGSFHFLISLREAWFVRSK